MRLLKNRLRTVIGEDAGFWKACSNLFYYAANPQRISRFSKKLISKIFGRRQCYTKWINSQQYDPGAETAQITSFFIVTVKPLEFSYGKYRVIDIEKIQTVPQDGYVLFPDDTDVLHPLILNILNKVIVNHHLPDLVSFDFDYITAGERHSPQFNAAWSPQRLRDHNYLKNAVCIKKTLVDENIGKERGGAASFCNRILQAKADTEITAYHLDQVLLSKSQVLYTIEGVKRSMITDQPLISIIIPSFNKSHLVKQCIDSILKQSTYTHYEIILVDNRSTEPALFDLIGTYKQQLQHRFTHLAADYAFNFSRLMNDGASVAKGAYLLLLNNDTEIISPDWMEQLLVQAADNNAGCVGARLLYPNKTIQHAGIILEPSNISRHIHLGEDRDEVVYQNAVNTVQNYLAVTAACLMVGKEKFLSVDGFDESYEIEFNDIDFCLRIFEKGYYNIYTPYAVLYHYESASRQHPHAKKESYLKHRKEAAQMREQWSKYIGRDPFANRNALALKLI